MKHQFVKTENHRRFLAAVAMLQNRGSMERCILPVTGKSGVGKTKTVDNWGSATNALYIEGVPGMTLRYLKDHLLAETGITARGAFAEFAKVVDYVRDNNLPIILDECQHGFPEKAECIEYLRRVAEKAGVILVLVCHKSEAHLMELYDHIKTRIGCVCELMQPTAEDTALFIAELAEIEISPALAAEVHRQSGARYRLITDAIRNLELIARKKGKTALDVPDVAGLPLCQDWDKSLRNERGAR